MGFAKCSEDNIKIMEERLSLRWRNDESVYSQSIESKIINKITIDTKVMQVTQNTPKKGKRKTKRIICCECNKSFKFTGGEQHYYERHNLSEPKRCPECREKRKELFK